MPTASSPAAFRPRRKIHHPFEGRCDTRRRRRFKEVARTLPRVPGVYFFYGWDDRLLYVGKACCLRQRVGSYFAKTSSRRSPKLRRLLAEVKRLDWRECGSELEALLLERRLIAEQRPLLNLQHKRFEIYPYLLLTAEEFPRFTVTRAEPVADGPNEPAPSARRDITFHAPRSASLPLESPPRAGSMPGLYLGPFTSPRAAAFAFEAVRSLFPLRSCEGTLKVDAAGPSCFYHDIGRCSGPCVGAVSREAYARLCQDLVDLLSTGDSPRIEALRARMMAYAAQWKFEEAGEVKQQLAALETVAARLRRLRRMREQNNVAIVQPAVQKGEANLRLSIFLVQGGLVRRHLTVDEPAGANGELREALHAVYDEPPGAVGFTAKTELDEMMLLDRWLRTNGKEPFCLWQNNRPRRGWVEQTMRDVAASASSFATAA